MDLVLELIKKTIIIYMIIRRSFSTTTTLANCNLFMLQIFILAIIMTYFDFVIARYILIIIKVNKIIIVIIALSIIIMVVVELNKPNMFIFSILDALIKIYVAIIKVIQFTIALPSLVKIIAFRISLEEKIILFIEFKVFSKSVIEFMFIREKG